MAREAKKDFWRKIDCQSWQYALFLAIFWRFLVFLVAVGGYFLLEERYAPALSLRNFWRSNFLFWSWANFDGEHYLKIAQSGYGYNGIFPLFAFFPFYPILLKFFSYFFAGDLFLAGQLVIFIFLPFLVYFGNRILAKKRFSREEILLTDFLFLFSPGGVFLNAFYTELPFLLFSILSFYFLEQKKYFWASFWAALASATRVVGVFLPLAIFWDLWKNKKVSWFKKIFYPLFSALGLILYATYLGVKFGNPLLFGFSQKSWGKAQIVFPLFTLIKYLKTILAPPAGLSLLNYGVVVLEFLIAVGSLWGFILIWIKSFKEKNISPLLIFSTFCFLLPLLTGSLGTMPRYFLTFLSLFSFLGRRILAIKSRGAIALSLVFYFFIFASGVVLFTRGYWWG